jgi:hypothetical protein
VKHARNHRAAASSAESLKIQSRRATAFCATLLAAATVAPLAGCHSHVVDMTIINQGPAVHVVELDYPSASFGTDSLARGGQYHYRFEIQGSGPLSLSFEDSSGKNHTTQGPTVHQGQEGSFLVTIGENSSSVSWTPKLK